MHQEYSVYQALCCRYWVYSDEENSSCPHEVQNMMETYIDGHIKWHRCCGKQLGDFSESKTEFYRMTQ